MIWIYVVIALVLILGFRVYAHFLDKRRIKGAALDNGWSDVKVTWDPIAPGWFFEGQERHYVVSYTDVSGSPRERYCKIRLLGDIYWREESSTELPPPPDSE